MKRVLKHKNYVNFWFRIEKNMSSFHPLEFVGCGTETQLKWVENFNPVPYRFNPFNVLILLAF